MEYKTFLEQMASLESSQITYAIIKDIQKTGQYAASEELGKELESIIYSTITPLYSMEGDDEINKTFFNKLSGTGALKEGLEGIIVENSKFSFATKMFEDSILEVYGEGKEGASKYLSISNKAYITRLQEIEQELLDEKLNDEQRSITLGLITKILNISFSNRIRQAVRVYGFENIPDKYLNLIEYGGDMA